MDLSIVIVSFNTIDITRKCLRSVVSQTQEICYEIICVDNNSQDGSIEMIEKDFPSVILIKNKQNMGFAKAQNIGIQRATGSYILILNSDIYFEGNVCKKMIDFMQKGPTDRGAVGPQILNVDGSVAPSSGHLRQSRMRTMLLLGTINRHFKIKRFLPEKIMKKHLGFIFSKLHYHYLPQKKTEQVDFVDGMCILIKREVLEATGLFDEQFFFDYEILDLTHRINSKGWKILYYPEVQVTHLGAASRKTNSPILVETHRSELIYHAKYNPKYVDLIKTSTLIVVAVKVFFLKFSLLFNRSNPNKVTAFNTYRSIKELVIAFDPSSVKGHSMIPSLQMR